VVEGVRAPAGDEEVGSAVIVIVAHGDTEAVAAGELSQARFRGNVLEPAVATVVEEAVAKGRRAGAGRERSALNSVNVQPAIAVEVEHTDAAAHGLGKLPEVA